MVVLRTKTILNKNEIMDLDYAGFILECAACSCQFGKITEHELRGKTFDTRANLNVLVAMPLGSGKTSSFAHVEGSIYANDTSYAGMLGTINKDGDFVEGVCIRAAGRPLILDEFNLVTQNVKLAMNNLVEQNVYSRNLGFRVDKPISKTGKFFQLNVKEGTMTLRSRFSCIASAMFANKRSTIDKSWFTRFCCLRFIPSEDYYYDLSRGGHSLKINPSVKCMDFNLEDYIKCQEVFWNTYRRSVFRSYFIANPIETGYVNRALQDTIRMSAFISSIHDSSEIKYEDFQLAMKFFPMLFTNYIHSDLSEIDLKIISLLHENSNRDIAIALDMSPQCVSQYIKRLKLKGVI